LFSECYDGRSPPISRRHLFAAELEGLGLRSQSNVDQALDLAHKLRLASQIAAASFRMPSSA
jgi:hypothetical protein